MVTQYCTPHQSWKERLMSFAWDSFYNKLMKKDKESLNLVIDTLESMIESTGDSASKRTIKLLIKSDATKYVDNFKIGKHLLGYLRKKSRDLGIKDIDSSKRFYWNVVNDISKCLKRIRDDEAVYLLSNEDKELTLGFLERLERPPLKERYFF